MGVENAGTLWKKIDAFPASSRGCPERLEVFGIVWKLQKPL
jgi:hypothetical protein